MNKLLTIKNINIYIALIILFLIVMTVFLSDTLMVQSAQQIDILLKPCKVVDNSSSELSQFKVGDMPQICGEVLSEYLPLELDYYLVNSINNEKEIEAKYIKITSHKFIIDLPSDLGTGQYELEIKAGRRKHLATTCFEIIN